MQYLDKEGYECFVGVIGFITQSTVVQFLYIGCTIFVYRLYKIFHELYKK